MVELPASIVPPTLPSDVGVEPVRRRLTRELTVAAFEQAAYTEPPAYLHGESLARWRRRQNSLRALLVRVGGAGARDDSPGLPASLSMGMRWGIMSVPARMMWHTDSYVPPRDMSPPRTASRRAIAGLPTYSWAERLNWSYGRALGQQGNHLCASSCERLGDMQPSLQGRCCDPQCELCARYPALLRAALSSMRMVERTAAPPLHGATAVSSLAASSSVPDTRASRRGAH